MAINEYKLGINEVTPAPTGEGGAFINDNFKTVADLIEADETTVSNHISNTSNPHSVTKTQVGLGNVDNTSDLSKPISTATQSALDGKAAATDLTNHTGNTSNPHSVTKTQVGLSNVDNTSDLNKPISTATQSALDGKSNVGHTHTKADIADFAHTHTLSDITDAGTMAAETATNYYTSSSIDTLLTGKSDTGHTHTGSEVSYTGTATYNLVNGDSVDENLDYLDGAIYNVSNNFSNFLPLSGGTMSGSISSVTKLSILNGTTSANGIDFGADVNLYRSAADTLKTDDNILLLSNRGITCNTFATTGANTGYTFGHGGAFSLGINANAVNFGQTWTNTSGSGSSFRIAPTYNQASSTAANTDLLISRTVTGSNVGSGTQLLIDAQVGGASRFNVSAAGAISAIDINAVGNIYLNGSNNIRGLSGTGLTFNSTTYSTNGIQPFNVVGSFTGTGGTSAALSIQPTYNQTSSAGAIDLLINRTQTAVGAGTQRLIDAQVGGTSRFNVTNSGIISGIATSLASTSTDGLVLQNSTAATVGTQVQMSPRIRLRGNAWKSNATAASQTQDWIIENLPFAGTTITSSQLKIGYSVNGAAYTYPFVFLPDGTFTATKLSAGDSSIAGLSLYGGNIDYSDIVIGDVGETQNGVRLFIDSTNGTVRCYGDLTMENQYGYQNINLNGGKIFALRPAQYATGSLPAAASNEGVIVYDTTTQEMKYSDGNSWNVL